MCRVVNIRVYLCHFRLDEIVLQLAVTFVARTDIMDEVAAQNVLMVQIDSASPLIVRREN